MSLRRWIHTAAPLSEHGREKTLVIRNGYEGVVKIRDATHEQLEKLQLPFFCGVPAYEDLLIPEQIEQDAGDCTVAVVRRFLGGSTLEEARIDDPGLMAAKIGLVLREIHDHGWIHADVKPANIIIDEQGNVHVIDLPLFPPVAGEVRGSAPWMAPELWEDGLPTQSSDVYALALLVAWLFRQKRHPLRADGPDRASWARAHQKADLDLQAVPDALRNLIARMADPQPAARPDIQSLLDLLADTELVDEVPLPPFSFTPQSLRDFQDDISDHLLQGKLVSLQKESATTTSRFMHSLALRLGACGASVVRLRAGRVLTPLSKTFDGPWSAVKAIFDALDLKAATLDTTGDRVHLFDVWTRDLIGAAQRRPVFLLWEDLDQAGPDLRAFCDHLAESVRRATELESRPCGLSLALESHRGNQRLPSPSTAEWDRYRKESLRAELRSIADGTWASLVREFGHQTDAMLRAVERELGMQEPPSPRQLLLDTGALQALSAGWKERIESLLDGRAYGEAARLARTILKSAARSSSSQQKQTWREQALALWIRAAEQAPTHGTMVDELLGILDEQQDPAFGIAHARLLHGLGRHQDGFQLLATIPAHLLPPLDQVRQAAWQAQLCLSSGRLEESQTFAHEARRRFDLLKNQADAELAFRIEMLQLAPGSLQGQRQAMDGLFALIVRMEGVDACANLRARSHAYRAFGHTRNDELEEACDAYLRALEEIEAAGLDAELPTYLLNVGTAYHRRGQLGLAREYYARGTRAAHANTRPSTRALLMANQANIDIALGRYEEAGRLLRLASEVAQAQELQAILAMCWSLRGDLHLARSEYDKAIADYQRGLDVADSDNRQCELHLALASVHLQRQEVAKAKNHLGRARIPIDAQTAADHEHYYQMLRARLQWLEGGELGRMAGVELFRRSLHGASQAGNHKLVLQQAPFLVDALTREGLQEALDETIDLVSKSRNIIATGLTRQLRRDFFANLSTPVKDAASRNAQSLPTDRRDTRVDPYLHRETGLTRETSDVEPFYRMLALNEVIQQAQSLEDLAPSALDVAIELARAERGFLLLKGPRADEFHVAASRDVDGAPIRKPDLEISLSIAKEAARTGRTVVTLNARDDRRFAESASVVDLNLTSVLCVPVRDASGLLGALYLDHRVMPGLFAGEVPRLMEAFGHQVALALQHIRRLEALQKNEQALKKSNQELDALLLERQKALESLEERCQALEETLVLEQAQGSIPGSENIVYASRAMERVLSMSQRLARGDISVVITGESGVGKELIARAIHDFSPRKSGPFVALNCAAVPDALFESEIFGHVKGAFTDAATDRKGLLRAATGGTIFFDEIGELAPGMQAKLLRVLQEKVVRPVGSSDAFAVDVRVVCATLEDLRHRVAEGKFREDLYYRLAGFTLEVPPLRERPEDILVLARSILEELGKDEEKILRLTPEAVDLLARQDWPGNVRQLINVLRTAALLTDEDIIDAVHVAKPLEIMQIRPAQTKSTSRSPERQERRSRGRRRSASRDDVVAALKRCDGDRDEAAADLGVSLRTLYRYLKRWDLYEHSS